MGPREVAGPHLQTQRNARRREDTVDQERLGFAHLVVSVTRATTKSGIGLLFVLASYVILDVVVRATITDRM